MYKIHLSLEPGVGFLAILDKLLVTLEQKLWAATFGS